MNIFFIKKFIFLSLVLVVTVFPLFSNDEGSDRYSVGVTPKILEDGVQTDFSLSLFYTDAQRIRGEIRVRSIKGSSNDTIWDIDDSLMTRDRQITEIFFLPVHFHFIKKSKFTQWAGLGIYYENNKLNENGYFNSSIFFDPVGPDQYNAYSNDYEGNSFGPLIDTGLSFSSKYLNSSFSFGIVPAFALNRNQTWKLSPFMDPASYTVESKSRCGPYYYMGLDLMLDFKYVGLLGGLFHERSKLNYTAAGFDELDNWADAEEKFVYKTIAYEFSLLINLEQILSKSKADIDKNNLMMQIGIGRNFDEVLGGETYFMFGAKKFLY